MNSDRLATLRDRLVQRGLGGSVLTLETNIAYLTGAYGLLTFRDPRLTGTRWLVVPADPSRLPILIASDLDAGHLATGVDLRLYEGWTESRHWSTLYGPDGVNAQVARPEQWDGDRIERMIVDAIARLDLGTGMLATDAAMAPAKAAASLRAVTPRVTWHDATSLMYELRSVKDAAEVAVLRQAVELQETGMSRALGLLAAGVSRRELDFAYAQTVLCAADALGIEDAPESWMLSSLTYDGQRRGTAVVGSVFKMDCGVRISGYTSDGGRTACVGEPSAAVRTAHEILAGGHEIGREAMRPGVAASDVFTAVEAYIRGQGLTGYSRGHLGHSIGLGGFTEEPPFFSATDHTVLKPGMVLALETPLYAGDLGAFQIEDLILITDTGAEVLNKLPHDLTVAFDGAASLPLAET